jgi:hypothetical protein
VTRSYLINTLAVCDGTAGRATAGVRVTGTYRAANGISDTQADSGSTNEGVALLARLPARRCGGLQGKGRGRWVCQLQCVDCDCEGVTLRQSERCVTQNLRERGRKRERREQWSRKGRGMREWVE